LRPFLRAAFLRRAAILGHPPVCVLERRVVTHAAWSRRTAHCRRAEAMSTALLSPPIGGPLARLEGKLPSISDEIRGTRATVASDANTAFSRPSRHNGKKINAMTSEIACRRPAPRRSRSAHALASDAQRDARVALQRGAAVDFASANDYPSRDFFHPRGHARRACPAAARSSTLGSVIKKRRKKMRKHKKRKLLKRARHKRKR